MGDEQPTRMPVAMSIAGSDSGGNAGIQADLLSFTSLGVFGTTALTCITAQNPVGVAGIQALEGSFVSQQMAQITSYFPVAAAKTGMLYSDGIIGAVAAFFRAHPDIPLVVDPVMVASSGAVLLEERAIQRLQEDLLPLAAIQTPNLDECAVLLGQRPENLQQMRQAARQLSERFGTAVLVKGGHLDHRHDVVDVLVTATGEEAEFHQQRIYAVNTHGSGCTLSAAITAGLAAGKPLPEAVQAALDYLHKAFTEPLQLGCERFLAH